MDERIIPAGDPEHRHAQLHLPWYATGRLDAAEAAQVARHVAGCAACREDLALEMALVGHEPVAPTLSADAGWSRLAARLARDEAPAAPSDPVRPRPARKAQLADWRGWALAAQFVLIVLLGAYAAAQRAAPTPEPRYHVLGRPQTTAGDLLVMFAPETPEGTFREVLTQADARVVDGPTVTGAYVLQIPAGEQRAALSALRASPRVTLAEPLGPEPRP